MRKTTMSEKKIHWMEFKANQTFQEKKISELEDKSIDIIQISKVGEKRKKNKQSLGDLLETIKCINIGLMRPQKKNQEKTEKY